jgi:hypothetical protein
LWKSEKTQWERRECFSWIAKMQVRGDSRS